LKTVVIRDGVEAAIAGDFVLDLMDSTVHDCIGCWACWWKTPGLCAFRDLNRFYHEYITADRAIFLANVSRGFVSPRLKTLFDRLIPLYLPYVVYDTGESMHVPRYDRYPEIEFYYQGEFQTPAGREIFEDYIRRVFYQFHCQLVALKPVEVLPGKEKLA